MSEEPPQEKLQIPDLPPTSADYDSLVADATGGMSPTELNFRLNNRQPDGTVREGGRVIYRNRDGDVGNLDQISNSGSTPLKESRQLSGEQRSVVSSVAERIRTFSETEKGLQSTASFLGDVLANAYSPTELNFRLNNRQPDGTVREGGRVIYRNRDGDVGNLDQISNSGSTPLKESRQLSGEQRSVVSSVAERIRTFSETEKGLQSTASFLGDVLANAYSPTELNFRLNNRQPDGTVREGGRVIYRNRDGDVGNLDQISNSGSTPLKESRQLSGEQRSVVQYIAGNTQIRQVKSRTAGANSVAVGIVQNGLSVQAVAERTKQFGLDDTTANDFIALANLRGNSTNNVIDEAVIGLLANGDDTILLETLDQQRAKFADISDATAVRTDINTLETYVQTARRISLRSRFWQQATDPNRGINSGFTQLEEYEIVDDADKLLVQELRNEGLGLRRDNLIKGVFDQISTEKPDFGAAAILLGGAAKTIETLQDADGTKILQYVADVTYQGEVNTFFRGLIGQLGLDRTQIASVIAQLDTAPVRPSIAGVDYFAKFQAGKETFTAITDRLDAFAFELEVVDLRKRFSADPDVQALVQEVVSLPGETAEDSQLRQMLLDELALITTASRGLNPGRFALLKEVEIDGLRRQRPEQQRAVDLAETIPERNAEAVKNLVGRFQKSIMPLFEALRGGEQGDVLVDKYVSGRTGNRAAYVQRVQSLEEQRELTDIERAYLESVELLTVFNPHLVALAREKPELTSLYLEQYFVRMDAFTKENLVPDSYVPVVQIGLGPNGVAAASELNRANAAVASQALYVEATALPGGPFGVAKGQSWELNSANSISRTTNVLPDVIPTDEQGISVRSYGSPLVSYPGERKDGEDVRLGSINVTSDYLLNPDNVSTKRYPTNADLARVLQLQSAMLVDNAMFSTRVIDVQPVDDGLPGDKRVLLEYTGPAGERITNRIRTDSIIVAGGLGEPNFGIKLAGSEAEKILLRDQSAESDMPNITDVKNERSRDGFPKLTDTIGAFQVLSSPEGSPAAPEGTIAIYGGGNSADVLIEYLGRQFESGNSNLNGIKKVYVLTTAELSKRPRYAQINDLKSRNGQASFLELVPLKVTDVREDAAGKLELIGDNSQPITVGRNGGTKVLKADHVIAASGFRPMLDEVFGKFLQPGESLDARKGLGKVSLPSNPGFSIADELLRDPNIVIVGTGSRADFKNPNKLGQLPDEAREALLRNGAENAVAIGFRTPDTRAAIRLKYAGKEFAPADAYKAKGQEATIDTDRLAFVSDTPTIKRAEQLPLTRRDVEADSDTLSALLLQTLPPLRLTGTITGSTSFTYTVVYDQNSQSFTVEADRQGQPADLSVVVANALTDPYVQSYALKALKGRRINRGLSISLAFSRGRLQYRDPGDKPDKGRTYVEVL